jgi:hypothetical protein
MPANERRARDRAGVVAVHVHHAAGRHVDPLEEVDRPTVIFPSGRRDSRPRAAGRTWAGSSSGNNGDCIA